MELIDALRLEANARLALVGAGGKTAALFRMARQYRQHGARQVFLTASTHLGREQAAQAEQHFFITRLTDFDDLPDPLPQGVLLFTGAFQPDDRTQGLGAETLERLRALADGAAAPLLIEADGSRRRPLKAPAAHEPAIPPWVRTVVVVAGLSALGKMLSMDWVHRPEIYARLAGQEMGQAISLAGLERVLTHAEGGLKNIPAGARRVALLNQADNDRLQTAGAQLAGRLLAGGYDLGLLAALAPPRTVEGGEVLLARHPVAGIVLAAGGASRLEQPKQLLPWRGQPLVRRVAETALAAGLHPVVVVTGAFAEAVAAVVVDLPVVIAPNPDWQTGQSTSLRTGLHCLPSNSGAAVFLLADQPQTPVTLVESLVAQHARTLASIVAPLVDGQRGNPVLFDQRTFADLLALSGDTGGRALFSRYPVTWLPWHDAKQLLDIDRPEDYQRLLDIK
jgi:molybdenum cofactor cytidylyltransferase